MNDFLQYGWKHEKMNWHRLGGLHCSQWSILFNIVTPGSGSTILFFTMNHMLAAKHCPILLYCRLEFCGRVYISTKRIIFYISVHGKSGVANFNLCVLWYFGTVFIVVTVVQVIWPCLLTLKSFKSLLNNFLCRFWTC